MLLAALALLVAACEKKPVEVTDISLDASEAMVRVGETLTLTATVLPENADDKNVRWYTSAASVASVDNGVVKAREMGTTRITAASSNLLKATCDVTCYSGIFTINGKDYPVTAASGYKYPPVADMPGDYDITLTCNVGGLDKHIRVMCPGVLFGEKVDMSQVIPSTTETAYVSWSFSSWDKQNENFIAVFYNFGSDAPYLVDNLWTRLPITVSGSFCLKRVNATSYGIELDAKFSDGTQWKIQWSGYAKITNLG